MLLYNLHRPLLWQDEAETALVGQTILENGYPRGTDGKNFFAQNEGREYGKDYVWKMTPWVQFYLTAASFAILEDNTFTARLPFVLLSLVTLLLLYRLSLFWWGSVYAATLSGIILVFSANFLMLSRQARYYSPAMLFAVWMFWGYYQILRGHKWGWLHLALAATLLLHSHYLMVPALAIPMCIHAFLLHRKKFTKVFMVLGAVALVNLPYFIWFLSTEYISDVGGEVLKAETIQKLLEEYFVYYTTRVFSPITFIAAIVLVAAYQIIKKKKGLVKQLFTNEAAALFWLTAPIYLLIFALTVDYYYLRYMAPLIPLTALYLGWLFVQTRHLHFLVPAALMIFLLITVPIKPYWQFIQKPVAGPITAIVKYLESNASPNDTVAITYGDLPIKFYTNLRVVGGTTGENLAPAQNARFIFIRQHVISRADQKVQQYLLDSLNLDSYKIEYLSAPDFPFEHREDPELINSSKAANMPNVMLLKRQD